MIMSLPVIITLLMLVAAEDAVAHVPAAAAHAQPQDAGPTVVDAEDVEAVVDEH